jgi:hypothetical protein
MNEPAFDAAQAHRHFAAAFFNEAWDLIGKASRTTREDQLMVALVQASICHWMKRPDCTDQNLSIGFWQASRVYTLVGAPQEALRMGQACLACSDNLAPFYRGFAHESLARAAALAGDAAARDRHLAEAHRWAAQVTDADERAMLDADLATVPT